VSHQPPPPARAQAQQPTRPVLELWQAPNRRWRWRYLEPSGDSRPLAFDSNKDYDSRQAALASATTAYPGVTVLAPPDGDDRHRGRARRRLLLLALAVVVVWVLRPPRRRPRRAPDGT
jgi:hypothetical protein